MPNQINASGKFLAGFLLTLFLLLPVMILIGYWPDKLPATGQCPLYSNDVFHIRLLADSMTCVAKKNIDTSATAVTGAAIDTSTVVGMPSPGHSVSAQKPQQMIRSTTERTIGLSALLLLLVAVGGFLGAMIHVARSFVRYVGADEYANNWLLWYVVKPFIGTAIALIGYMAFEGKMLGGTDAVDLNLYRVMALAILTGMFTDTATDKLKQVFETIFTPKPDNMGKEVKITGVKPEILNRVGETNLLIQGANLKGKDLSAQIGGVDVKLQEIKDTTAMIKYTPTEEQMAAGKVELQINYAGKVIYKIELKIAE